MAERKPTLRQWLHALRAGFVTFGEFERGTRVTWEKLASYFFRRWPEQSTVSEEDVKQDVLLAVWRAVREWDPERGVSVERFVWYAAGVAGQRVMKRAHGYTKAGGVRWSLPLPKKEQAVPAQQARVAEVRGVLARWAGESRSSMEREVALGLLEGRTLEEVARDVYDDPVTRYEHWLMSENDAEARVRSAARRIRTRAAGAA